MAPTKLVYRRLCTHFVRPFSLFRIANINRNVSTTASVPLEQSEQQIENSIKVEKSGNLTIISLNRPESRNSINAEMAKELCSAINKFENDESSSVAVLHGVGGSFSSGYDMKDLMSERMKPETLFNPEGSVGPTRRIIEKPIVCGISGFCVANGLSLALMCDLRVIEEDATLGFFNRRFGVPLVDGCTARLPALIGLSRALDLILTGRVVTAKEAFDIGLANRIVASGTSLGQAVNLANSIAKFPQSTLKHDRDAAYESAFNSPTFYKACQNEIMTVNKAVLNEMSQGVELFKKGLGRGTTATNIKMKTMADWEQLEYERELKMKEIKQNK